MKFSVITDCLKKPLKEAIPLASKMGFQGVQIYATSGYFSPDILTFEAKNKYKKMLADNGLVVSALCGDMGGYGFEIEEDNYSRIEKTKKIIDLAVEFDTRVVTTHIGVIPDDCNDKQYLIMLKALKECGSYAYDHGVTLAIETGPEKAKTLLGFVKQIEKGVGVNLDPANFRMVTNQDETEATYLLKDYIVHTHLKDGKKLDMNQRPVEVYHSFAVGGVAALNACKGFSELPLGEGDVDWDSYLKALNDIGYKGFLTVEREAGDNPIEDINTGIDFIKRKLKSIY